MICALIPLRGGSKGIKNKNIKEIAGKPLCAWALEAATNSQLIDDVYVSTDSAKIKGNNYRKIPGGLHLCYRFEGHVRELNRVFNDLFAVWMPHRGYIMGQGFCFERYHKASVPGGFIVMDLCIPILSTNRAQIQK